MTTSLLIINCLECNCGLIDYWLFEHTTREWWGYCSCIYPSLVSLKEIGVVGLDTYTWGIKDFHKCWSGSLAKRRLLLGPAGVINCTPLSALSFWVSLFPKLTVAITVGPRLQGYPCLSDFGITPDVCPGMGLLGPKVVLCYFLNEPSYVLPTVCT